jgi:hypothetical protein
MDVPGEDAAALACAVEAHSVKWPNSIDQAVHVGVVPLTVIPPMNEPEV